MPPESKRKKKFKIMENLEKENKDKAIQSPFKECEEIMPISWFELEYHMNKPVFEYVSQEWKILCGYERTPNYKFVSFTDTNNNIDFNKIKLYEREVIKDE